MNFELINSNIFCILLNSFLKLSTDQNKYLPLLLLTIDKIHNVYVKQKTLNQIKLIDYMLALYDNQFCRFYAINKLPKLKNIINTVIFFHNQYPLIIHWLVKRHNKSFLIISFYLISNSFIKMYIVCKDVDHKFELSLNII